MAQTSKRKQYLRRLKRQVTVAERYVYLTETILPEMEKQRQEMTGALVRIQSLVFGLLAQNGNKLTVTKGTMEQVAAAFDRLKLEMAPQEGDDSTLVVTMVEEPVETPDVV